MSGAGGVPNLPGPRVGVDEWVASAEARTAHRGRMLGTVERAWNRLPVPVRFALLTGPIVLVPLLTNNLYVVRVGTETLIYMLLALGLNVAVGFAGLLDLGYVAFFGFGAYTYAILSSGHFGWHLATWKSIPIVVVLSAALGVVLGSVSRRLLGDYLAIVTLFFLQIFVVLANRGNELGIFSLGPYDLTGGPNGIANIDSYRVFGHRLDPLAVKPYFYAALVVLVVVSGALYLLSESRIGRAWRAVREDPLAAELMGMPVFRLKLLAFSLGAAIAGLTGTLFAGFNTAVFSTSFDATLLITIYAMVILGGAGSIVGVALGAVVINVSLEVLRTPDHARWIFYAAILVGLAIALKPWWKLAAVLGSTVVFGLVVRTIAVHAWPTGTKGDLQSGGALGDVFKHWVVLPTDPKTIGNWAFVILIAAVIALKSLSGIRRLVLLVPTLYLAAFVWENRLVEEPSVTRLLLIGAILIVLMNARPQGLLGTSRVEIV
jgi:branched-chain amino acid transport system permease protein